MQNAVAAHKPQQQSAKRMTLQAVRTGKIQRPMRILLYGTEGVGKSTFASSAPSPIFLGTEEGTGELDVARLPEPSSWQDITDAIDLLANEEHQYRTLVLDTLDWMEPVCWRHVCQQGKKQSIEDFGYGKGYVTALDEWRALLVRIDGLRTKRGMHVIALAHAWIKAFANPIGDNFDRYELKLNNKAAGLWKEWSDAVLFATYEDFTRAADRGGKAKATTTGARIIHTQRHPAWDAKTRYAIPEQLPLDWETFWSAVQSGTDPVTIKAKIDELIGSFDEKTATAVKASVARFDNNSAELARILNKLSAIANGVTQ
jgi:hypothetical protein